MGLIEESKISFPGNCVFHIEIKTPGGVSSFRPDIGRSGKFIGNFPVNDHCPGIIPKFFLDISTLQSCSSGKVNIFGSGTYFGIEFPGTFEIAFFQFLSGKNHHAGHSFRGIGGALKSFFHFFGSIGVGEKNFPVVVFLFNDILPGIKRSHPHKEKDTDSQNKFSIFNEPEFKFIELFANGFRKFHTGGIHSLFFFISGRGGSSGFFSVAVEIPTIFLFAHVHILFYFFSFSNPAIFRNIALLKANCNPPGKQFQFFSPKKMASQ